MSTNANNGKPTSKLATDLQSTNGQAVTFPVVLELERLDGQPVQITFTCKFKGKRAWSKERREYSDQLRAIATEALALPGEADAGEANQPAAKPAVRTLDAMVAEGIDRDAALVAKVVTGWSLPQPCDVEALADLEDNFGTALGKFIEKYERAIYQGVLGN
jgi:hypothetical protein